MRLGTNFICVILIFLLSNISMLSYYGIKKSC
nr:MAG TPA_asm: hypothetical protein [Caudoviricetes sp.]